MIKQLIPSVLLTIFLMALTGLAYPLAVTKIAQTVFPTQANGSLVERNGTVVGSERIAQGFDRPDYFHPRPSATTAADPNDPTKTVPAPYNAANSGGSNAAPTSKAFVDATRDAAAKAHADNPKAHGGVPVDLVTASGSGLDPDISPEAAEFQVARVAQARHAPEAEVRALVAAQTAGPVFGMIGEPVVNVLNLNLALDQRWPIAH